MFKNECIVYYIKQPKCHLDQEIQKKMEELGEKVKTHVSKISPGSHA